MPTKRGPTGVITRLDVIIILVVSFSLGAALLWNEAEASDVIVEPAPALVKVQPVSEMGPLDKLREWFRSHNEEEDDTPILPLNAEGQRLPTETSDKLEFIFEEETAKKSAEIEQQASFDAAQVECQVRNLVFEAGGEPEIGQRWVYDVVRNRTLAQYRGNDTMCETIFDPKQFSWANLNPDRVPGYTADLLFAQELVSSLYFDPNHRDITCGATHYLKKDIMWDVSWSREALQGKSSEGLVLLAIIGKHAFFGKEGCPNYEDL